MSKKKIYTEADLRRAFNMGQLFVKNNNKKIYEDVFFRSIIDTIEVDKQKTTAIASEKRNQRPVNNVGKHHSID